MTGLLPSVCARDEAGHGALHRELVSTAPGEPVQPASARHETTTFQPAQPSEEALVTYPASQGNRMWVPHHQGEQPCFVHASR